MFCAACRQARPVEELLAFWPVRDPGRRRHVCRPSLQRPEVPSCFRFAVGPTNVHAIELAARAPAQLSVVDEVHVWRRTPELLARVAV